MKSRARVNPISVKRKNDNVLRAEMMEEKYGPRPWKCLFYDYVPEGMAPTVIDWSEMECHGEVNGHEVIKVSQWRADRLANVVTLCNFHNGWVEDNPETAYNIGLMKHAWEQESLTKEK